MVDRLARVVLVVMLVAPVPMDVPAQCDQINFRRANPGLCEESGFFPTFPPSSGGGSSGGLLGRILHGIGGLL